MAAESRTGFALCWRLRRRRRRKIESAGTVAAAWSRVKARLEQIDDPELKRTILDYRAAVVDLSLENYKLSEQLRAESKRSWVRDEFVIERNAA